MYAFGCVNSIKSQGCPSCNHNLYIHLGVSILQKERATSAPITSNLTFDSFMSGLGFATIPKAFMLLSRISFNIGPAGMCWSCLLMTPFNYFIHFQVPAMVPASNFAIRSFPASSMTKNNVKTTVKTPKHSSETTF